MDHIWNFAFVPYGSTWKLGRKMLHSQMHSAAAAKYQHIQLYGACRFVCDLLAAESNRPADKLSDAAKSVLPQLVRRNFAFTAVHMIYGIDVRDPVAEARYVDVPEKLLHLVSEGAVPGRFWVDFIPIRMFANNYDTPLVELISASQCNMFPHGSRELTSSDLPSSQKI